MDKQEIEKLALTILAHDWDESPSFQYDKFIISQFKGTAFDSDYACYKVQWLERSLVGKSSFSSHNMCELVAKVTTDYELQALKELSEKGYPVPRYIASMRLKNQNVMIFMHKVPGDELYSVTNHGPWIRTAKEIAKIQKDYWVNNSEEKHNMHFPESPRFNQVLCDAWRNTSRNPLLKQYMEKIIDRVSTVPQTFIHGDMFPTNVLVHNEKIRFVDFADVGLAPYMMDMGRLTGVIDKDTLKTMCPCPEKAIDAYYREIRLKVPLDYEDYLSDIRMAQFLELAYIYCPPGSGLYLRDFKIKVEQQLYHLASIAV